MNNAAAYIRAWKPHGENHMTPCELDDPAAKNFNVHYAGAPYGMPIQQLSKMAAEDVCNALIRCHEAGGKAKLRELRLFLMG